MTRSDVGVRLGAFLIVAAVLWLFIPVFLRGSDRIATAIGASLVAGLAANLVSARIFENGRWGDFGLGWSRTAPGQWGLGFALGLGSVAVMTGAVLVAGLATIESVPVDNSWALTLLFFLLLAGAAGEELLFRGYPFQYLVREWNPGATIVGSGVLFGLAHLALNSNINPLGALNTALWGALLGYAYWRTRALWLPVGLHFGWNLGLVLIGVPLSGTTIKATGFGLQWSASPMLSGGEYGPEGGVLASVLGVAVFAVVKRVR